MRIRRRGTAIVETPKGILLVAGRNKRFMLPGGEAKRGESRFLAAQRELREETGLEPTNAKILFRYLGNVHRGWNGLYRDEHTVVLIKAKGSPRPKSDAKYLAYYTSSSNIKLSSSAIKILEKYFSVK